jgi:hypothetical protein
MLHREHDLFNQHNSLLALEHELKASQALCNTGQGTERVNGRWPLLAYRCV